MKFRFRAINWNLAIALALACLMSGCASNSKKKEEEISTIRLHFEVHPQLQRRNMEVSVLRAHPVKLIVAEEALVHEGYLNEVSLLDEDGSHRIRLKFDDSGRRLFETETAVNLGKHIAVFAQFPESRWIAAPVVKGRISDGVFVFTPDMDLAEARRLVDGLKRVIEKRKKDSWID